MYVYLHTINHQKIHTMNHLNQQLPIFYVGTQPDTCKTGCNKVTFIHFDTYCPYMNWVEVEVKGYRLLVDASQLTNLTNR